MSKPKRTTWLTYQEDVLQFPLGEVNNEPSLTVPDQTLSLDAMLKRYVVGGSVEQFTPVYTDNEFIPDNLERMDEIDKIEHARSMKKGLKERIDYLSAPRRKGVSTETPEGTEEGSKEG